MTTIIPIKIDEQFKINEETIVNIYLMIKYKLEFMTISLILYYYLFFYIILYILYLCYLNARVAK